MINIEKKRKRLSQLEFSSKKFKVESNKYISKIAGARINSVNNSLEFYVHWEDYKQGSYLPASITKKMAPEQLLDWYEKNLLFDKEK